MMKSNGQTLFNIIMQGMFHVLNETVTGKKIP